MTVVPPRLRDYPCDEYFSSALASTGLWDEAAQLMLIVAAADLEDHPEIEFLEVGRPGTDGILFGYRASLPGFWAYYPLGSEFKLMAFRLPRSWKGGNSVSSPYDPQLWWSAAQQFVQADAPKAARRLTQIR